MLTPTKHIPIDEPDSDIGFSFFDSFTKEECQRACNDMLRNASTGMMSWAEKNFKQKLIDNLFNMHYYKDNQTIYLNPHKGEK